MANASEASREIKWKTGAFTVVGLLFMGALTVYINNRPFWWRSCEPIQVTVPDATGLKKKSPVKSLGLDIGYISGIGLVPRGVSLNICVTAPVAVTPETRAYVRSEGFLGDKFLELKPVKYIGTEAHEELPEPPETPPVGTPESKSSHSSLLRLFRDFFGMPEAFADDTRSDAKRVPVGEGSTDMQALMSEMKSLTTSLKESINPDEIRSTIRQLNKTLEDASRALSPQGGLTQTAQRSLIKLEDAIDQMRDQMTRINQGEGSVGMVLNDPAYAEELKKALKSLNQLLGRASEVRLVMDLGVHQMPAYNAARSTVQLALFPKPDRYYLLGGDMDPRGNFSQTVTTAEIAGTSNTVQTTVQQKGGFNFTVMVGKILRERFDVAVGLLRGDGATRFTFHLGPTHDLQRIQLKSDLYFRAKTINGTWTAQPDARIYTVIQPVSIFYLIAGVEGFRSVDNHFSSFFGAGMRFEDEDIKLLLSFL
jgi:phospholipid/cholesterol/gamma-HCH transport system substrate-binding protein